MLHHASMTWRSDYLIDRIRIFSLTRSSRGT